jgi:hypothetical protein
MIDVYMVKTKTRLLPGSDWMPGSSGTLPVLVLIIYTISTQYASLLSLQFIPQQQLTDAFFRLTAKASAHGCSDLYIGVKSGSV